MGLRNNLFVCIGQVFLIYATKVDDHNANVCRAEKFIIWMKNRIISLQGYNQVIANTYSLPPNFDQTPVFRGANIVALQNNEWLMSQIIIPIGLLINLNQNL